MRLARWLLLLILLLPILGFAAWGWHRSALRQDALAQARSRPFPEAEQQLQTALLQMPTDVELLEQLAKGCLAQSRKAEADEYLTRWLDQTPEQPEALRLRSDLYRELGQFALALRDIDRLIQMDPNNLAWCRKRAGLLYSASRFDEADKECQRCLSKQPGDKALLRARADLKRVQGDSAEAGAILDAILKSAPQDAPTLMARALLHHQQGESEKAIPLFQQVLKLDPNRQRSARYHLALALSRVGQTEEADRLMGEVRKMQDANILLTDSEGQPRNLPLQMRAARAQFENNDLPKTAKILSQVLTVDADYGPAHGLLAEVLDKQGNFDLAAEHRRRAKGTP